MPYKTYYHQWKVVLFCIIRVRLGRHSLHTPKKLRASTERMGLAEAQAANDSARYSSRSAMLCVFHSDYRPYFVRLAPFACRVLVRIS